MSSLAVIALVLAATPSSGLDEPGMASGRFLSEKKTEIFDQLVSRSFTATIDTLEKNDKGWLASGRARWEIDDRTETVNAAGTSITTVKGSGEANVAITFRQRRDSCDLTWQADKIIARNEIDVRDDDYPAEGFDSSSEHLPPFKGRLRKAPCPVAGKRYVLDQTSPKQAQVVFDFPAPTFTDEAPASPAAFATEINPPDSAVAFERFDRSKSESVATFSTPLEPGWAVRSIEVKNLRAAGQSLRLSFESAASEWRALDVALDEATARRPGWQIAGNEHRQDATFHGTLEEPYAATNMSLQLEGEHIDSAFQVSLLLVPTAGNRLRRKTVTWNILF